MRLQTSLLTAFLLVACADGGPSDHDLDDEAALADGKADGLGSITRLERVTPAELVTDFVATTETDLATCFAAYRAQYDANATSLTRAITEKFISLADEGCADWYDLGVTVKGVLDKVDQQSITPGRLVAELPAWARPQVAEAVVEGFVSDRVDLLFYDSLMRVREANARERERAPAGIDLAAIRAAWEDVRNETTLDRAYLNPVTFPAGALDSDDAFRYLRAAFPLRTLRLVSTGRTAIADFASAGEGPENDPAFAPIATALRKTSIKKRFYFARQGEWSSNVLIVVDAHGQAWGMQMGYSE